MRTKAIPITLVIALILVGSVILAIVLIPVGPGRRYDSDEKDVEETGTENNNNIPTEEHAETGTGDIETESGTPGGEKTPRGPDNTDNEGEEEDKETHEGNGETASPGKETGILAGEVRAEDGSPIPNATVCSFDLTKMVTCKPATTDENGSFTIINTSTGNLYQLYATAEGYLPGDARCSGNFRPTLTLSARGCTISGRVTDPTGYQTTEYTVEVFRCPEPLTAILHRTRYTHFNRNEMMREGALPPEMRFRKKAEIESPTGEYTVSGLPTGAYLVFAYAEGLPIGVHPESVFFKTPAVKTGIDIALSGPYSVSGRLIDSNTGEAVTSAEIEPLLVVGTGERDAFDFSPLGEKLRPDSDGCFVFERVAPLVAVCVKAPNRGVQYFAIDTRKHIGEWVIDLAGSSAIKGKVYGPMREPLPHGKVGVFLFTGKFGVPLTRITTADAEGNYCFDGLPPCAYWIYRIDYLDRLYRFRDKKTDVLKPGETVVRDIGLEGSTIIGTAYANGKPASNVGIKLDVNEDKNWHSHRLKADEAGGFIFDTVPNGNHIVKAYSLDPQTDVLILGSANVRTTGGEIKEVEIRFTATHVTASLVDEAGNPIRFGRQEPEKPRGYAYVCENPKRARWLGDMVGHAWMNGEGIFDFGYIKPGEFYIDVKVSGYSFEPMKVNISGDELHVSIEAAVPEARISGIVVDAETNEPIPNIDVWVGGQRLTTGEQGRFSGACDGGEVHIIIMRDDYRSYIKSVEVFGAFETRIQLAKKTGACIKLTGTVRDAVTYSSIPGSEISGTASCPDEDNFTQKIEFRDNGTYEVFVPSGKIQIRCSARRLRYKDANLKVDVSFAELGGVFNYDILLQPYLNADLTVSGRVVDKKTGKALAGVTVSGHCYKEKYDSETQTREDGTFSLNVPRAETTIYATADNYVSVRVEHDYSANTAENTELVFELTPCDVTLSVRITYAGYNTPFAGECWVTVRGRMSDDADYKSEKRYDAANGSVSILIPEGNFTILVYTFENEYYEGSGSVNTDESSEIQILLDVNEDPH